MHCGCDALPTYACLGAFLSTQAAHPGTLEEERPPIRGGDGEEKFIQLFLPTLSRQNSIKFLLSSFPYPALCNQTEKERGRERKRGSE